MNYKNELRELFNIFNETDKIYNELAHCVGLNHNQLNILYYIETHKNVTQKNITDDLLIPKQTVNTILSNWIKENLITFENENSKKYKIILFTEAGKNELLPKVYYVMNKEAQILERLDIKQIDELIVSNANYLKIMKEVINDGKQNG